MTESKAGASSSGRKGWKGKGKNYNVSKSGPNNYKAGGSSSKNIKRKRGKHGGQKNKKDTNCFNCGKPGHFACDCTKPKVMIDLSQSSDLYVSSCIMLAETVPYWTVDSAATNHVTKDRGAFVDFRRVIKGSRCIFMGK